jgi:hypothetical protein
MPADLPRLLRAASELELSLSAPSARRLGAALRLPEAEVETAAVADAAPYDHPLAAILVRRQESGKVMMRIDEESSALVIEGGEQYLAVLAENIEGFFSVDPEVGDHLHIEYFDEHFYLAPSDLSLVVVPEHAPPPSTPMLDR